MSEVEKKWMTMREKNKSNKDENNDKWRPKTERTATTRRLARLWL